MINYFKSGTVHSWLRSEWKAGPLSSAYDTQCNNQQANVTKVQQLPCTPRIET
ncbi:uncharacterized protein PHALS_00342 [Plasmopara halstedii]|uniref:Uncharacterized protein n=1 Tax=Plasmopara halstedii TaxID=4781 RepID=A0A0P1A7N3_PLAHL|nr:uncharacterized protein PHALS_00342 [Plasmopara halstedii]CEG36020.1 hypothetical protein PHALS_00342 [Plasmopara halstedii]|eukprot:XP_024572389.1 hypothetical protein PHALS_00342 [Plasmopara halstedii]